MNEIPATIRSETIALDTLIKETIAQAEASTDKAPADTMVFLGNRHQSFPTAVVKDPVLEPVDKLIWMVIMLAVHETGSNTAFPGYESIGKMANVSSRSTIARAIAILRATRWLTLCARIRKASGQFRGNVYALHDEPLPLADALHLDSDYMFFLGNALGHGHARVRAVAQGALDSINEDVQAGQTVCVQPHPIEQRLQSVVASKDGDPRRFFSFTRNIIKQLRSDSIRRNKEGFHHDQKSNPAGDKVQNSNAQKSNPGSCSSYINKTTTTHSGKPINITLAGENNQPLIYPARLCDNHQEIAARYLSALAPEQRQPILDELEGRFRAEKKGMQPVYDEISFLHSLCKQMKLGKFQPNLGIRVRNKRLEPSSADSRMPPMKSEPLPRETEKLRQQRMATSKAQIGEMRRILGMRSTTESQDVTKDS